MPDTNTSRLRSLIGARTRRSGRETLESLDAPPRPDDVLAHVDETMRRVPESDMGDPLEYRRALAIFMRRAEGALRKLDANPDAPLDRGDTLALEAVIRTDGTRPSLLVRESAVDPDHALAGDWRETLAATRETLRERIAAIGRIEPANAAASNFFGTGWLVDAAAGLVLTNLHVLEAMWRRLPNAMIRNDTGFRILPGAAFIDFVAESGSLAVNRFPIVEARPSGIDGGGFERLDVAVLKIGDAPPDARLPAAIPVVADLDAARGGSASFCAVGYPGRPPFTAGVHEGIDWVWVNTTLFGGRYGVKRLAPGVVHKPLGAFPDDPQIWIFGHDATTLGGSSGSPILAWQANQRGAFGIHFAGASVDTNCAHAIAECRDTLEQLGVPVRDPE